MRIATPLYQALSPYLSARARGAIHLWRASGSALVRWGWFESFARGAPVSADGAPVPWLTYTFTEFVEPRLRRDFAVFEFGMGYSTLWWAARTGYVACCEHDRGWFAKVEKNLPSNARGDLFPEDSLDTSPLRRGPAASSISS